MILIQKHKRFNYLIDENGIVYRECRSYIKPIEKRLGSRGYCEFKMGNKTVLYHKIVAQFLIPNPNKCNEVWLKNPDDKFNMHPSNLFWVFRRCNQNFTIEQALERTTDIRLIEYYNTGDKKLLQKQIVSEIEKMTAKKEVLVNHLGSLYELIFNYAERNLLFNLQSDIVGTYIGLCRQEHRNKHKTVSLNKKTKYDKELEYYF